MSEQENYFKILQNINVNHLKDKKGKFDYLSWADAVTQLLLIYPDSTWEMNIITSLILNIVSKHLGDKQK